MVSEDFGEKVRSLFICDFYVKGVWDLLALQEFLPPELVTFVSSIQFNIGSAVDTVLWQPDLHGQFSIRSAYQLVRKKQSEHPELKHVWNGSIPVKLSIFAGICSTTSFLSQTYS